MEGWEREEVEGRKGELDITEACLVSRMIRGMESFVGNDSFVDLLTQRTAYDLAPPAPRAV